MQRRTTTLARSLRVLTALSLIALTATPTLAGPNSRYRSNHNRHANNSCSQCDRRDYHVHDNAGGVLWIGADRFDVYDRPGALNALARKLKRAGYHVVRHANEFHISSHNRLGRTQFRNGSFRSLITERDRCSVTIVFIKSYRDNPYPLGSQSWNNWPRARPAYSWRQTIRPIRRRAEICW